MKTPSLPKTIKPFDIVAAVKRAIKKATDNNEEEPQTHELDRLHSLFIINAWAASLEPPPSPAPSGMCLYRYIATGGKS